MPWTLVFICFTITKPQLSEIVFKAMVFWSFISEIVVLKAKRGSMRSRNCSLVHLDSFHEPSFRNLIAKVAKAVVFDAIFDMQFLITSIWTYSLFFPNVKVLIWVLAAEIELNNFPLALIMAAKSCSLCKEDFRPTSSGSRTVVIFIWGRMDDCFSWYCSTLTTLGILCMALPGTTS